MTEPTTRTLFKEKCLRALGYPVLQINVDDDQVEDRIDDALSYYQDFHFDGTERMFFMHPATQQDIDNKYLTLPDNIISVNQVMDFSTYYSADSLFNVRYQIALNDMFNIASGSLIPYYLAMRHLELMEFIFSSQPPFEFTRHSHRLRIDTNWGYLVPGQYIVAECYSIIDPNAYSDVWSDRWLFRYATALIKRQWGNNIKLYNIQLPGQPTFNGQQIYNEAHEEVLRLQQEALTTYSYPPEGYIG